MTSSLVLAALLFGSGVLSATHAGNKADAALVLRADQVLHQPYAALAVRLDTACHLDGLMDEASAAALELRSSTDTANTTTNAGWNATTSKACMSALSSITRSSSISGTSICYNLPSLDNTTGAFIADLRLYQVSPPRGSFADVKLSDISVQASFDWATVRRVSSSEMNASTATGMQKRSDSGPTLLQTYLLAGQIDKRNMSGDLSMATLQTLLMPNVQLSAMTANGTNVTTSVSPNEAAFLNGVFSHEVVMSDFAAAEANVDAELAKVQNFEVPFVLPGVDIMIFPIGLVVTLVWTTIGTAVYAFGTVERIRYANAFKKRQQQVSRWGRTDRM